MATGNKLITYFQLEAQVALSFNPIGIGVFLVISNHSIVQQQQTNMSTTPKIAVVTGANKGTIKFYLEKF